MKSKWTGERLETHVFTQNASEHLHRYAIASELVAGKRVLDIASGEGYGSNLMAEFAESVTGVDINAGAVGLAQKKYQRPNLTYREGDAAKIPLEDGSVDVVVSFETIEHHDKHDEMMREIKRVLVPGGVLLISSPNRKNYSNGYVNPFHVKELYKEEFVALMKKYFRHTNYFSQLYCEGSWVVADGGLPAGDLPAFTGDYQKLIKGGFQDLAVYNLCFASDHPLPEIGSSMFENHRFAKTRMDEIRASYENSVSYRVGRVITSPGRIAKIFLRRL